MDARVGVLRSREYMITYGTLRDQSAAALSAQFPGRASRFNSGSGTAVSKARTFGSGEERQDAPFRIPAFWHTRAGDTCPPAKKAPPQQGAL